MNELDQQIKAALQEEDRSLEEQLSGEPAMHEMVLATFHSRYRWLVVITTVVMIVIFVLQFFVAYQFFQADAVKAMIGWATGFMMCWTAIAFLKLQFWIDMNRHAVTREVKRLELQVAQMERRLSH